MPPLPADAAATTSTPVGLNGTSSHATDSFQPRRILVTGGCGFIGSHFISLLLSPRHRQAPSAFAQSIQDDESLQEDEKREEENYAYTRVIVLDSLDYCSSRHNLDDVAGDADEALGTAARLRIVHGDILDAPLVRRLLAEEAIDTIVHFAAQSHVDNSFANSLEFTRTNVLGTHVLLEAARMAHPPIRRFLHISTDEVYGETVEVPPIPHLSQKPLLPHLSQHPLAPSPCSLSRRPQSPTSSGDSIHSEEKGVSRGTDESAVLRPTNPYAASKAGAEMLVFAYIKSYGLPALITRSNNVYGPRQYPEKVVPKFTMLALQNRPLPLHGDGRSRRAFVYAEDAAAAVQLILHKGRDGEVYNIAGPDERSVLDIAEDVTRIVAECHPPIQNQQNQQQRTTAASTLATPATIANVYRVADRPFNDYRYHLDDSRLRALGWTPKIAWEDGLRSTIAFYRDMDPMYFGHKIQGALDPHPRLPLSPKQQQETNVESCRRDQPHRLKNGGLDRLDTNQTRL